MQEPVEMNLESEDYMCTPILAAYVMEGKKALGVIYQDDIIEEIILNGKDPKKLKAKDIMKPPVICYVSQEVSEVVNLIIDKGLYTVAICDGEDLISVISVYDAVFLYQDINDI